MGIAFKHHVLFVMHAKFLRYVNRGGILWINHRNQSRQTQGVKCIVADSPCRFCRVTTPPIGPRQPVADLRFRLAAHVRKIKQATIANRFRIDLLDYCPRPDSRLLPIVLKITAELVVNPFGSLDTVSKTHHFRISEYAIYRVFGEAKLPEDQSLRFDNDHALRWIPVITEKYGILAVFAFDTKQNRVKYSNS